MSRREFLPDANTRAALRGYQESLRAEIALLETTVEETKAAYDSARETLLDAHRELSRCITISAAWLDAELRLGIHEDHSGISEDVAVTIESRRKAGAP